MKEKHLIGKSHPQYKHGKYCKTYKNYCINCGKLLSRPDAKRCRKCCNIKKNNPFYKNGKSFNNRCIDCNKKISYGGTRCRSCSSKFNWKKYKKYKVMNTKEAKRKRIENRRSYKGKNHPNWQGGISKEPYPFEFNEALKYQIRYRDNFTCQLCGMIEEEHIIIFGKVLIIHHIDYNKMNCKEENLITTCNYCNSRVNFNRKHWTKYFKEKINGKEKRKIK